MAGRLSLQAFTWAVLAALAVGWAIVTFISTAQTEWAREYAFADLTGYLDGARRFLETGSPYEPAQIAGAWTLGTHSFIHPPTALLLFVPFLLLPAVFWWIVPLVLTAWIVASFRPRAWAWLSIALCLVWPRSAGSIIAGNSDMWAMALVAVATRYGVGPFLALVKPSFLPLALVGLPRGGWFMAGVVSAIVALPFIGLWGDYARALGNAHLDPAYSLLNLPLVVTPAMAWIGRTRGTPRTSGEARGQGTGDGQAPVRTTQRPPDQ